VGFNLRGQTNIATLPPGISYTQAAASAFVTLLLTSTVDLA
jgi:hypothetical protein